MKTNWQYSMLSSSEKLDRIRNGDMNLFNTEMTNSANYASVLRKAGADASRAYDNMINLVSAANTSARKARNGTTSRNTNLPKYASGENGEQLNKAYRNLENARKKRAEALGELEEEREVLASYVAEWLINNGYSLDGNLGSKKLGEIQEDYETSLKEINDEYDAVSKPALRYIRRS